MLRQFGITPVVAINHRAGDGEDEIKYVQEACAKMGVKAVVSMGWANGEKELRFGS